MKLQSLLSEADKSTTEIVAVAPEGRAELQKMADKVLDKAPGQLGLTLLADPDHAVVNRYGLLNEPAAQKGRFVPHPTTYVIDSAGTVRWKFTEIDYKIRPTNEMVLEAVRAAK